MKLSAWEQKDLRNFPGAKLNLWYLEKYANPFLCNFIRFSWGWSWFRQGAGLDDFLRSLPALVFYDSADAHNPISY